jgi:hypothetical protein
MAGCTDASVKMILPGKVHLGEERALTKNQPSALSYDTAEFVTSSNRVGEMVDRIG